MGTPQQVRWPDGIAKTVLVPKLLDAVVAIFAVFLVYDFILLHHLQ